VEAFVEKSALCDSCSDNLSYKCHFVQMPPTLTEHEVECSEPATSPRYQRLEFSEANQPVFCSQNTAVVLLSPSQGLV